MRWQEEGEEAGKSCEIMKYIRTIFFHYLPTRTHDFYEITGDMIMWNNAIYMNFFHYFPTQTWFSCFLLSPPPHYHPRISLDGRGGRKPPPLLFHPFFPFMPPSFESHWTLEILEKLKVSTWPFLVFNFPCPLSQQQVPSWSRVELLSSIKENKTSLLILPPRKCLRCPGAPTSLGVIGSQTSSELNPFAEWKVWSQWIKPPLSPELQRSHFT